MSSRTLSARGRLHSLRPSYICPSCQHRQLRQNLSYTSNYQQDNTEPATPDSPETTNTGTHGKPNSHLSKHTVLSMIQPTGTPHLGNYLGALRNWKSYQDQKTRTDPKARHNHKLFFAICDLHSLTGTHDRLARRESIKQTFAALLAIGLSPKHSNLFIQSTVRGHTELMWILSTVASMGYLSRMTQWKSKSGLTDSTSLEGLDQKTREKLKLGLFSYPVLQAADILLYQPDLVPVGEDQLQHVEFTRTLARSFNSHYAKDFPTAERPQPPLKVPRVHLSPAKRIMSLTDPARKMSKSSDNPKSNILIIDTPEDIRNKINGAVTDSIEEITYAPAERPGVSNLVEILKHTAHPELTCEDVAKEHEGLSLKAFKALVADAVIKELDGVREKYVEVMDDKTHVIQDALSQGHRVASSKAGATLKTVREAVGFADDLMSKKSASANDGTRSGQYYARHVKIAE